MPHFRVTIRQRCLTSYDVEATEKELARKFVVESIEMEKPSCLKYYDTDYPEDWSVKEIVKEK